MPKKKNKQKKNKKKKKQAPVNFHFLIHRQFLLLNGYSHRYNDLL